MWQVFPACVPRWKNRTPEEENKNRRQSLAGLTAREATLDHLHRVRAAEVYGHDYSLQSLQAPVGVADQLLVICMQTETEEV